MTKVFFASCILAAATVLRAAAAQDVDAGTTSGGDTALSAPDTSDPNDVQGPAANQDAADPAAQDNQDSMGSSDAADGATQPKRADTAPAARATRKAELPPATTMPITRAPATRTANTKTQTAPLRAAFNPRDFVALDGVAADQLQGVEVEDIRQQVIGTVTKALSKNGSVGAVVIVLSDGREQQLSASALRFNVKQRMLLTNVKPEKLGSLAGRDPS